MSKKTFIAAIVILFLFSVVSLPHFSGAQEPVININGDGTVTPSTAPIKQTAIGYALTGDVNEDIIVGISNIVFDGNGYHSIRGVFLIGVSNVTIQNCSISTDGAISLDGASNITIVNNTLTGADFPWYETGTISIHNSYLVKIEGNVMASGCSGIIMMESHDNLITENNITGMSTIWPHESAAIILYNSTNNTFYHNNFFNNAQGVTVNGISSGNTYDNGYPNGGNYWSDNSGKQWGDRYPLSKPFTTTSLSPTLTPTPSPSPSPSASSSPNISPTLSPPANAATSSPIAFPSNTQFTIPAQNATIIFAQNGTYETANLDNGTWIFTNLYLNSPNGDLLVDSPTIGNLRINAQDSNVTIDCFDRLISPYPNHYQGNATWQTQGWLNYTVNGTGTQTIKIQFNLVGSTIPYLNGVGTVDWPIFVSFYAGGNTTETGLSGDNWPRPYGIGLTVNGESSYVGIGYQWVNAPINPDQQSQTLPPLLDYTPTPSPSPQQNVIPALVIAAVVVAAVVVVLLIYFRKRRG
ncbi:MAG TPA: NosD domain-containing protein [Candidatus Nanoarchaeia archaeon]|nr:NosD domain-containing protein [Candidatus Nanoarchaeia archaeon]